MSNHPTGFPGFQSRREAMAELLGGDWLAHRATEDAWDQGLMLAMRNRRPKLPLSQRWASRAFWVNANDADWDLAARYGENTFSHLPDISRDGLEGWQGWRYAWDHRRLVRLAPATGGIGITLATARSDSLNPADPQTKWCVSATDDGAALAEWVGKGLRTQHTYVAGPGAARRKLGRWAADMAQARPTYLQEWQ